MQKKRALEVLFKKIFFVKKIVKNLKSLEITDFIGCP